MSKLKKMLSDHPQWVDEAQHKMIGMANHNLLHFPKKQATIYALIIFVCDIMVVSVVTHAYMKEPHISFEMVDADWNWGPEYEELTGRKVWSTEIFHRNGFELEDYDWVQCNWFESCDHYTKVDGYEGYCDNSVECLSTISVGSVYHMDIWESLPLALTYLHYVNITLLLIFFMLQWLGMGKRGSSEENIAKQRMVHILKQLVNTEEEEEEKEGVLDVEQPTNDGAILVDDEKEKGASDPPALAC